MVVLRGFGCAKGGIMFKRLKQLFCRHDWQKVSDKMVAKNGHYFVIQTKCQCSKCGKVVYR